MANTREAGIKAVVENLQGYLRDLDKMIDADGKLDKSLDNVSKSSGGMGKNIASTAVGVGLAEVAMRGLDKVVKFGIGNFMSYEHAIDAVGAVAGATESELKLIGDTGLRIGKETAFGATEAAVAMESLAANGISVKDIIGGAADAAAALAAAGGTDLPRAADTVSTAMAVWGGTTQELTEYVNRLAGAANVSRFGVEDMSAAIAMGGGAAAGAGVEFGDFTTTIAAIAPYFSSGSDAGTAFKTMMQRLSPTSKEAATMMKELGIITEESGNRFFDAQGNLKSMAEISGILTETLGGLSEQQKIEAASTIFGTDAMRAALGMSQITEEQFKAMDETMKNTSAAEVASQRMQNLSGDMEQLTGSLETLGIQIGSKVAPAMTTLVHGTTELINMAANLPPGVQNMMLMGTAIGALVLVLPKAASMLKTLNVFTNENTAATAKARLATLGWVAALTGLAIGADYLLKKTTGEGLMAHIMGSADENQRTKRALEEINTILQAFGDQSERVDKLTESLKGQVLAYSDVKEKVDAAGESYRMGIAGQIETGKQMRDAEVRVRELAKALQEQGVSVQQLKLLYDELPPRLQAVFDAETGVVAAYGLRADADEKLRFANLQQEQQQRNTTAAVEESIEPVTRAVFGFEQWANALEQDDKWLKNVQEGLDGLIESFASANPEVANLTATNAFLNETIQDLERNSESLNEDQKAYLESLKEQVEANDDIIAGYSENEKALKGAQAALQNYMGPVGLGNLLGVMQELKVPQEDQIGVLSEMHSAYLTLGRDGVPAALSAFGELKDKLSPEIWAPIANELGPKFVAKIVEGYTGEERVKLLAAAEALGLATPEAVAKGIETNEEVAKAAAGVLVIEALAAATLEAGKASAVGEAVGTGVVAGLNSAANRITAAARGLARGMIEDMKAEIESDSPSKVAAREVGEPIGDGVAVGIEQSEGRVAEAAVRMINKLTDAMRSNLDSGLELTKTELGDLLEQISGIISDNPMPDAARKLAQDTITGWAIGIGQGEGLANQSLIEFFDKLQNTILKGASDASAAMKAGMDEVLAQGGSYMLGDDGKWYKSEKDMPKGVGGASSLPQTPGFGLDALNNFRNATQVGPDSSGKMRTTNYTDIQGIMSALAQGWITGYDLNSTEKANIAAQYSNLGITPPFPGFAEGTPFVPFDMLAMIHRGEAIVPATQNPYAMAAMGPSSGVGGDSSPSVIIDLRGAQLTGSIQENQEMMESVVRNVMNDEFGRSAYLAGMRSLR